MRDSANIHLKIQELCDCFATSDPLLEMSRIRLEPDPEAAPLKYLALLLLHGLNNNAESISLQEQSDGSLDVVARYRPATLPGPGAEVGKKIVEAILEMTQLDSATTSTPFAFGFRNNSLELRIDASGDEGTRCLSVSFPES